MPSGSPAAAVRRVVVADDDVARTIHGEFPGIGILAVLTTREREVLAHRLYISEGAVEKHVRSILSKLQLPATDEDHRRVLAVLMFLDAR